MFVPTSGIHHTSNVQPGSLVHSPPSASLPFELDVTHAFVLDDVSAAPEGRTDVRMDENEVDPPNPDIHPEEVLANADDNLAVPPGSPEIPIALKPAKRKSQQNRCNITTKTGRKKIPHNISSVSIDGISFYHEENVQRWKFMVQRRIAYEINVFGKHQSCMSIMDFIERAGNVVDINCSPSSPSTDVLASVLSGGSLSAWPINGIPAVALSIKYEILHKIGIANWFPSSNASSVSAALENFLYQICNDNKGNHVPNIDHDVHPFRGSRSFSTNDWNESVEGFFVNRELASRIVNSLTAESRALFNSINLLSEWRGSNSSRVQDCRLGDDVTKGCYVCVADEFWLIC
ncbi:envelope-like protein [Cucumis melo var. makuwa]|uniref:Envelope-like protein n=1 Tax=Cucumis melo var. makuwa TaxID=1194695 RepID=A0A5A7UZQ8_CUCMM|nr:envelope-like protein [Cucumis melo var. makuwa]